MACHEMFLNHGQSLIFSNKNLFKNAVLPILPALLASEFGLKNRMITFTINALKP